MAQAIELIPYLDEEGKRKKFECIFADSSAEVPEVHTVLHHTYHQMSAHRRALEEVEKYIYGAIDPMMYCVMKPRIDQIKKEMGL